MKITLALVSSVNGHITDGMSQSVYDWTSTEDQQHFFSLIKQHSIIVMGKNTYLANKNVIKLETGKLRIILTTNPEKYSDLAVPAQLEFSKESPTELITRLPKNTMNDVLVVGGSQVAASFLKAGLIDQLLLTIEPVLFGEGLPMLNMLEGQVSLKLNEVKRLNEKGTLLLNYALQPLHISPTNISSVM